MYFHENKNEFKNFIRIIREREKIDSDIIESSKWAERS